MLADDHSSRRSLQDMLVPAFMHTKTILTYVYEQVIRGNWLQLLFAACLGAAARFLNLLSFVAALKAALIAIDTDHFISLANKYLTKYGIEFSMSKGTLIIVVIAVVAAISIMASLMKYARAYCVSRLQSRFLREAAQSKMDLNIKSDQFLIDKVAPSIDTVVTLFEIMLFCFVVCVFIAMIDVHIVLFMLSVLVFIPVMGLFASRRRLRVARQRDVAQKEYERNFPLGAAGGKEKLASWIDQERQTYISAVQNVKMYQLQVQRTNQLAMTVGLIALIIYISIVGMGSARLISISLPLIFIVLALRQVVAQANEFGRGLSLLLELRNKLDVVSENNVSVNGA